MLYADFILLYQTEFSRILAIVIAAAAHCTEAEQKQIKCTKCEHHCTAMVRFL